jgi:hypothetical protein
MASAVRRGKIVGMKFALGIVVFVAIAILAVAGKWVAPQDSLSNYTQSGKPVGFRRFSLSTLLIVAVAMAFGFGLFVILLKRT